MSDQHITVKMMREDFRYFLLGLWQRHKLDRVAPLSAVELDVAAYLQHGPNYRVIMAFREFGKSYITCAYVTWRLWLDASLTTIISSASQPLCKNAVNLIRFWIDDTPWLEALAGRREMRERTGAIEFDVAGHRGKDPSVAAVSITSQLTGRRAMLIVADDVETYETTLTRTQRTILEERTREYTNVVHKRGGHIVFLGCPQHMESVYEPIYKTGIYSLRSWPIRYPAADTRAVNIAPIIAEAVKKGDAQAGDPTCPHRFTQTDIDRLEASNGRSRFSMQFDLHLGIATELVSPLRLEDFICFDCNPHKAPVTITWGRHSTHYGYTRIEDIPSVGMEGDGWYGPIMYDDDWAPYARKILFVDASQGQHDETAWAVVGQLHGYLYVLAVDAYIGPHSTANLDRILGDAERFEVNELIFEEQGGGATLAQLIKPLLRDKFKAPGPGCPDGWACGVDTVHSTGQKEVRIIETLEAPMNQHRIVVNTTVARDTKLAVQITQITRDRRSLDSDDRIDALASAVKQFTGVLAQDARARAAELKQSTIDEAMAARWGAAVDEASWIHYP